MVHEPAPNSLRAISAQGKVLILGGRSSNFPNWVKSHPRVVIWFNTNPSTWKKDTIPAGVELIILTRFVDHKLKDRVSKNKPASVRMITTPISTGKIKSVLETLGVLKTPAVKDAEKEKDAAQEMLQETRMEEHESADQDDSDGNAQGQHELQPTDVNKRKRIMVARGALRRFLLEHANLSAASPRDEAKRLVPIAQSHGLTSSYESIATGIRQLQKTQTGESVKKDRVDVAPDTQDSNADGGLKKDTEFLRELADHLLEAATRVESLIGRVKRAERIAEQAEALKGLLEKLQ